ncbi:hypothetical protein [Mucilaginibacter sp. 21P]|uniref:hypothetical protein n=1 Tax=Mucilaginibacter sp. 21P TaxID=2778902 RepID=UPI001C59694E|nr:hypothetical protein [Mucilaginibacter sp. 21P]
MIKKLYFFILMLVGQACYAQSISARLNNKVISFDGKNDLNEDLKFNHNSTYLIKVYQENIDIEINLYDKEGKKLASTDLADGNKGYDKLEYAVTPSRIYRLNIRSVSPQAVPNGIIKINISTLSKAELNRRKRIAKEMEPENAKDVTTIDIKHFWEAYDHLNRAKNYQDSVHIIQADYLGRYETRRIGCERYQNLPVCNE